MEGQRRDLMEVNKKAGAVEEIHSLERETIPSV